MWLTRALTYVLFGNLLTYQELVLGANRNFIRSFEDKSFTYRNDTFAYISKFKVFDQECEGCDALVQFFPGGYVSGNRFDHAPLMQYLSLSYNVQPWSIEYRLLDEGSSYDEMVSDARAAMIYLRARLSNERKIVVLGSSAGGDLALRVGDLVDGLILDSSPYCVTSPKQFTAFYAQLYSQINELILASSSYVCNTDPKTPAFVAHGEDDNVVLVGSAKEYARLYPSKVTACFAQEGVHVAPFSSECIESLEAWIDATFGWTKSDATRRSLATSLTQAYVLLSQVNSALQDSMPDWFLDIFVRRCRSASPIEAENNGCESSSSLP